jgi:hypothetical protein
MKETQRDQALGTRFPAKAGRAQTNASILGARSNSQDRITPIILHPSSYILHPTSIILHPTSNIQHPTPYTPPTILQYLFAFPQFFPKLRSVNYPIKKQTIK